MTALLFVARGGGYVPGFLCALLLAGCAVNPATGRRQTMLISQETEFNIGKRADTEVRNKYGVYLDKPELRAYVSSVGESLARKSARSEIEYHFEIVDSPIVNAFALPGGFVYVTRGILERMNSEDELSAVLGHEIAHVAARHGAAQISKAYIAQFGLITFSVFNPASASAFGDLANLAINLALQGYSREYERQADDLGFQYAASAGYNPKGSVDLLQTLARLEKKEPSTVEAFFSSHPRTSERIKNARQEVQQLGERDSETTSRPIRRDDYLSKLEGMAVGVWNGRALVLEGKLYDKERGLVVEVPKGFTARLESAPFVAVFDREKEKMQASVRVDPLPKKKTPEELAAEFEKTTRGLKRVSIKQRSGSRLAMTEAVYSGRDSKMNPVEVRKAFLVHEGYGIALTVVSPPDAAEAGQAAFDQMAGSLTPLTPAEVAAVQPPRLRIRRVSENDTWSSLAGGEADRADRLASYNGFEKSDPPPIGRLIKIPPSLAID